MGPLAGAHGSTSFARSYGAARKKGAGKVLVSNAGMKKKTLRVPLCLLLGAASLCSCTHYRLHLSLERTGPPPRAASDLKSGSPKSEADASAAPRAEEPVGKRVASAAGTQGPGPFARSAAYAEAYRTWRSNHMWLIERLQEGLRTPSFVREELNWVRQALLALEDYVPQSRKALLHSLAEQYTQAARRYVPGRGSYTARFLERLGRRVERHFSPYR